jgi:hypothetical protein
MLALTAVFAWALGAHAQESDSLQNEALRAEFDDQGLKAIQDKATQNIIRFAQDGVAVYVGDHAIESDFLKPVVEKGTKQSRVYRFESGSWTAKVVYELHPGWRFVSKQVFVSTSAKKDFRVHRIEMFRGQLATAIAEQQRVRDGVLLRFADQGSTKPIYGMFAVLQNPFLLWKYRDGRISVAYSPNMDWKPEDGPFASDRVCFGTYSLSDIRYPASMVPEWKYVPEGKSDDGPWVNMAEVDALVECVRAFLLVSPRASIRVHVPWCENDYQIDIATPEGRAEYKRIIDQAAALGCRHMLFTPANYNLAPLKENRDAWGWENLLWLGLGQKIRKGEWDPTKDAVPPSVQELIDHAKSRGVKPLAYVYPSLPFMQNPEWTQWIKGQPGGYAGADTGQRSFRDWLVDKLVDFAKKTGVGGYSFDHWWIAYEDTPSSKYAQWYGCRRILETLRRRIPDVVMDGRQQYHQFGVWTWLAGSYPHPLNTDEQPGSFKAFPDLHFDRVSADRQRHIAWWYRMHCFTPPEIMPGFITHQTERNDPKKGLRRDRFRPTDWDYLGWRYSLLSSIATAPMNHVVNMIPARDPNEYQHFSEADKKWFRDWLDWTDCNFDVLRNVRPIIGQPRVGRVDGTAAFKDGRGFVFLFNPNYRPLLAELTLDASIGLTSGERFVIRQLYPDAEKGKVVGSKSHAFWNYGDKTILLMPGTEALVLEIGPAPERIEQPLLFNAAGSVAIENENLNISDLVGEVGSKREVGILVPSGQRVRTAMVNGKKVDFKRSGDVVTLSVQFAGAPFGRCQQVGQYDPKFAGGTYRAEVTIPGRVFKQLDERKRQWPIPYTEDDLLATWLGPHRLLLFVNVADPTEKMNVALKIDGKPVELKRAYSSVYPEAVQRTFVGWYADVSSLTPDQPHTFDVELPPLAPGQFQGLFFENVEAEFTKDLASPANRPAGEIRPLNPPEGGFYSKVLDYDGIPIKAHKDVSDEALYEAKARLSMMLDKLPTVRANLRSAGAELHIIGRNQVTSDLPEHRHLKGKPFDGRQTVDERTRGLGGLLTSCGEENLLRLERDRYRGRDICVHEFAHGIYENGIPDSLRQKFREQHKRSLAHGLWVDSYAGSNADEFFAELHVVLGHARRPAHEGKETGQWP